MNLHDLIGDIITVILCIPVVTIIIFSAFWAIYEPIRAAFGKPEEIVFEKSPLAEMPLGAPRDGGNYVREGDEWVRLDQAEMDELRRANKRAAKARARKVDAQGWEVLAPETQPHHSGMHMEIMNDMDGDYDGPDDRPDDDTPERPDEIDFS